MTREYLSSVKGQWGPLGLGSVLWLSKERPYTQKEQESFVIITSSKTWNLCIFICKKQCFPGEHNLYLIFKKIFLSHSSQRLTFIAILKLSVVTELSYEQKCKSYGNENVWIRTVRPSIWFHERLSGTLRTASLFFINKSLLGRTHRLLLLWRIRKGEAESTAH